MSTTYKTFHDLLDPEAQKPTTTTPIHCCCRLKLVTECENYMLFQISSPSKESSYTGFLRFMNIPLHLQEYVKTLTSKAMKPQHLFTVVFTDPSDLKFTRVSAGFFVDIELWTKINTAEPKKSPLQSLKLIETAPLLASVPATFPSLKIDDPQHHLDLKAKTLPPFLAHWMISNVTTSGKDNKPSMQFHVLACDGEHAITISEFNSLQNTALSQYVLQCAKLPSERKLPHPFALKLATNFWTHSNMIKELSPDNLKSPSGDFPLYGQALFFGIEVNSRNGKIYLNFSRNSVSRNTGSSVVPTNINTLPTTCVQPMFTVPHFPTPATTTVTNERDMTTSTHVSFTADQITVVADRDSSQNNATSISRGYRGKINESNFLNSTQHIHVQFGTTTRLMFQQNPCLFLDEKFTKSKTPVFTHLQQSQSVYYLSTEYICSLPSIPCQEFIFYQHLQQNKTTTPFNVQPLETTAPPAPSVALDFTADMVISSDDDDEVEKGKRKRDAASTAASDLKKKADRKES